jgi:tetratricopeptide (TPR) repeat protein
MSAADHPRPLAQGDLAKTPFPHLVLYLHREGMSGTLVLDRGGYETKVLFRNGRAIAARPLPRGAALQDGLLELCALPAGAYGFWEGDLVGEGASVIRGTVDPFMFVTESLRNHAQEAVIAGVLERYPQVQLSLLPEADLKRLGLRGAELRSAEQLRAQPMSGDVFIQRAAVSHADARKLLYLLLVTKQVVPVGVDSPGRSGVRNAISDPPLAPRGTPLPAARTSGPVPRSSAPPGARPSVPAWQQLASRRPSSFTPRSTSAPPSVPIPSAPPPVEALDEAGKLRRAEQFVERGNLADALRIADDLIARDDKNADHHALRALILCHQFTGDRPPRSLVDAIDRALRLNDQHARALYVKGLVFKRLGRGAESIHYFQRALVADPQHLEAQRELRLAKMRRDR